MDVENVDPHLTATIVGSYVRHHTVGAGQLSDLITTVHRALGELGQPNQPEEVLIPAVSVRRSVHQDHVICLDCGYRGKTLRRHISARHGLSRDEYLKRWGLRSDHLLTAPAYSERRSTLAKELGLGRKPTTHVAPAATTTAPAPVNAGQEIESTPTPRRRSRAASKSMTADVMSEAVAAATPARRRSRSGPKSADAAKEVVTEPTPARQRQRRSRVTSPRPEQIPSPYPET